MRAKTVEIPTFSELYDLAPREIKDYIDRCVRTPQSPEWHPEGPVLAHLKIVYNRARKTGDINLAIASMFHDLGKADVTKPSEKKPGAFPAHGHENVSARLVMRHSSWIEDMNADPEEVYAIVKNHMRIKQFDKMRPHKKQILMSDPYFSQYNKFTELDDMSTLKDHELKSI